MPHQIIFITSTDTGVGKTVLTALLARHFRDSGATVAALKPVCSGGRDDARRLHAALAGSLTLDEINPWHFRAPLAPLLAARREGKRARLAGIVAHAKKFRDGCDVLLIEGAGGLLSPLGEGFDSRALIAALRATPVIVCPNRLGAVNQARLVLAALAPAAARAARVVLVSQRRPDVSSPTNARLLGEFHDPARIHPLPWLTSSNGAQVRRAVAALGKFLLAA
ncbi:MAG: dethiobiotin synthase [Verrucomicrobia bacterium]|nr:dethiobiotin synthase [Verrucomicrobiota bacterium]